MSYPTRFLSRGSTDGQTGGEVSALQRFLRDWGGANLQGFGIFGPKTERAVQSFQTQTGVDFGTVEIGAAPPGYGTVGPKTRAKIAEVCGQVTDARALEIARANGFTAPDLRISYRRSDGIRVESCNLSKEMVIHPNTGAVVSSQVQEGLCFRPIEEDGKIKVLQTPEVQTLIQKYGRENVHVKALDINLVKDVEFIKQLHPNFKEQTGCIIVAHAGDEGYIYQEDKNLNIIYYETLTDFFSKTKNLNGDLLAKFYLSLH